MLKNKNEKEQKRMKPNFIKPLFSLLLALLMLFPIAACAKKKDDVNGEETQPTGSIDTVGDNVETDRSQIKDGVPDSFSMDGKVIRILTRDNELRQMDVDGGGELLGDVIHEAVYRRNETVKTRLDTDFEITAIGGDYETFGSTMENGILSGDDLWDIVNTPGNASLTAQRDYLFMALENNPWLDFENPWWNSNAMQEISNDGQKIRYLVGDISLSMHHYSGAIFFNKKLLMQSGINPKKLYQTVIDGDWTYEKMGEIASEVYIDKSGDGEVNEGDQLGFSIYTTEDLKYLEYGIELRRYSRNEDGVVVIDFDTDRAATAVEAILKLTYNTEGVKYFDAETRNFSDFSSGKTVFISAFLGATTYGAVRSMTDAYGIIPYPKLDSTQEKYNGYIHDSAAYYAIPITCENADDIGAVLEVLCAESYRSVVEVYFETALKARYAHDTETGQCIDIIREVSAKNFLTEHNKMVSYSGFLIAKQAKTGQNQFASDYAEVVGKANSAIQDLIDSYNKLDSSNT